MKSNGSRSLSWRRPTMRVTIRMKKKTTVARITRSMASWEDRHRAVDVGERGRAVVDLDVLPALADVRRVDLAVDPGDQLLAGLQLAVGEHDLAVLAVGFARFRHDRVDAHRLPPAAVEDDFQFMQVLVGDDFHAHLEDQ